MPKISSTGEPSYAGHEGVVTNAVGEQFDVNPTVDLDGERKDGYTSEPDESFEPTPAPGVSGDVAPIDESDDENENDSKRAGRAEGGRDNDQRPRLVDHRQSEGAGKERESTTAAKKAAPPATKR